MNRQRKQTKALSKKQNLKQRTLDIMYTMSMFQLDPEQRRPMSNAEIAASYPVTTYQRNHKRGYLYLGLCYKKIRNLVKRYPQITATHVMKYYGFLS